MPETIHVDAEMARRFLVRSFALDGFQSLPTVPDVIDRLEFVQEDSINVCGRIHDLILWARVRDYSLAHLQATLYEPPRGAFEYYFPNLSVLPQRDLPYFWRRMQARESSSSRWGALTPDERAVAEAIYAHLDREGFLHVRETVTAHGHTMSGWGTRQKVATHVLEKLWLQGRLRIHSRDDFTRRYARGEEFTGALPDEAEERAYLLRKRLRARRLFRLGRGDRETLGADAFVPIVIPGAKRPWQMLKEDIEALRAAESEPLSEPTTVHLLAPLDPLIYDRERNREVFGFDYTWEVYTPAAKRRWGYYVLPILFGDQLIGRLDPKIDRRTQTLTLLSLTLEPGVRVGEVASALMRRLKAYARFLGATRVVWENVPSEPVRKRLEKTF